VKEIDMSYEERQRHQQLEEQAKSLRDQLEAGDPYDRLTRGEALHLLTLVESMIEMVSPERWDRALVTIAEEVSRRVGAFPRG
jgi:hypothetical protein